jgi:hypothetical protein
MMGGKVASEEGKWPIFKWYFCCELTGLVVVVRDMAILLATLLTLDFETFGATVPTSNGRITTRPIPLDSPTLDHPLYIYFLVVNPVVVELNMGVVWNLLISWGGGVPIDDSDLLPGRPEEWWVSTGQAMYLSCARHNLTENGWCPVLSCTAAKNYSAGEASSS